MTLIPVSGHGSRVENVDHNDYEADNMDEGLSISFSYFCPSLDLFCFFLVIWPVDVIYDEKRDEVKNYIVDDVGQFCSLSNTRRVRLISRSI